MSFRTSASRRLQFECLESKQVLAGDVTVFLAGGSLFVTGDADANQVSIASGATDGSVVITANDNENLVDRTGAAIGGTGMPVELDGFRGNVILRMGDGDDNVGMNDLVVPRTVRAEMGAGNDTLGIGSIEDADAGDVSADIGGSLLVVDRLGDNTITIGDARVRANAYVVVGSGDDEVNLGIFDPGDANPGTTLDVGGFVLTRLGAGANNDVRAGSVTARDLRILGSTAVDTVAAEDLTLRSLFFDGGGNDDDLRVANLAATGNVFVRGGAGDDDVTIAGATSRIARLIGDAGTDAFDLDDIDVTGTFIISGGGGTAAEDFNLNNVNARTLLLVAGPDAIGDTIAVTNSMAATNRVLSIIAGRGDDTVEIRDSAFASLASVRLSTGDDTLTIDTIDGARGLLDGGPGTDMLTETANMIALSRTVRFET